MTTTKQISIFICEDHPISRMGLKMLIEQSEEFKVIGEAEDGEAGVEQVLSMRPDAMDIFMAKRLTHLVDLAKIMDVRSILVGIRPAVALTLTDMEISFPGVRTAINLDAGFKTHSDGLSDARDERLRGDACYPPE